MQALCTLPVHLFRPLANGISDPGPRAAFSVGAAVLSTKVEDHELAGLGTTV